MRVLRARLYELEMEKQQAALAAERRGQIKSGDRSEKIRTYNYPQNRVTDHRIGLTLHQLTEVMDGKLAPMVDALVSHYEAERLEHELAQACKSSQWDSRSWLSAPKAMSNLSYLLCESRRSLRIFILSIEILSIEGCVSLSLS